jgi:murein DD-endopeptidase MepM/ murein hydrolase activator NlpD
MTLAAMLAVLWLFATPQDVAAGAQKAAAKKAPAKKAVVKKPAAKSKSVSTSKAASPAKSSVSPKSSASAKTSSPAKSSTSAKASAPATVKKPAAKQVAAAPKKSTKPAAKPKVVTPKRPPADLPPIMEASSAWQGCLSEQEIPELAVQLGIDESRLLNALHESGLPGSTRGCSPYVAATGGVDNAALAMFQQDEALLVESPVLMVHKTPEGVSIHQDKCGCLAASSRVLTLPISETSKLDERASASVPSHIRWTADTLIPSMLGELPPDGFRVRLVVSNASEPKEERLRSIELIEPESGERVDGAWWLERPNGPGVLIGMKGLFYEQLLWLSAVDYERQSRGVGPRYVSVRTKDKKTGKITTRRVLSKTSYHYGIDMTAKKGTDIHAVADAKVAFVGKKSGFGNLVILDHGNGYTTYYAHMSKFMPETKVGATVPRGQVIGLVGSTGRSTAPHLHFEVRQNNNYIDPQDDGHQLDFWLLTPDDQVQLAKQILAPSMEPTILAGATGIRAIQ